MTHLLKYTLKTTAEPPRLWEKKPLSESFHPAVHRSGSLLKRKEKKKASHHLLWYFCYKLARRASKQMVLVFICAFKFLPCCLQIPSAA